jgi:GTP pyrophosphokinase
VLERLRVGSVEELHEALALGDVGPSQVSRALHEHAQAQLPPAPPKAGERPAERATRRAERAERGNFTVEGVGNLLTQLARCCQPVPGDAIAGYLTRGRGVSIHRLDCAALQRLLARQPERQLPVNWAAAGGSRYEVGVQIRAYDRKWLLKDLTNVLAQSDAAIVGIQSSVDSARGLADVRVTLRVGDFEQLSQLLGRLDAVPGVQDARRLG